MTTTLNSWTPPQLPVLLLDVDGVLADFVTPYLKWANQVLGTNYTYDDITEHSIEDALNLSRDERSAVREVIDRMRMSRTMAPLPGAKDAVLRLSESANIFFVTSSLTSSQTWEYDRRAWLTELFGEGWGKRAQFVKDKYMFNGDVFVDDSPDNAEKWAIYNKYNLRRDAILWNQWYNKNQTPKFPRVKRTSDWGKVESMLWEKTQQKDVLGAWIDMNQDWLDEHHMKYVAVNAHYGMALHDLTIEALSIQVNQLPNYIQRDITIWFNTAPVPWKDGKSLITSGF